jgi:nitroreductase / dihydropteridine reductase
MVTRAIMRYMTNTLQSLGWRYATKKYDTSKKLTAEQLRIITEALRLSPSSFGLQPWKFIHVKDPAMRMKLRVAAYDQSPVTEASDFFVLAVRSDLNEAYVDRYVAAVAKDRGVEPEALTKFKDSMMGLITTKSESDLRAWATHQVYIALGVALLAAAENDIDATPMEGFNPSQFDVILDLRENNLYSCVCLAVGFRSPDDAAKKHPKTRFAADAVFIER